jgi:hypothetical protein
VFWDIERLEGGCDILGSPDFEGGDIEAERAAPGAGEAG